MTDQTGACTARIVNQYSGGEHRCVLDVGHRDPEFGTDHAGPVDDKGVRYRWSDDAIGAVPHEAAAPTAQAPALDRTDELEAARATNRRLNRRAQALEAELAAYRRAVADWEITDRSTYVPLRSLAAIARAAGLDVPASWELHYERVERAEAALAAAPAVQAPATDQTAADVRDQLLHAIDHAYANGVLGYETPEELLAAYDASRAAEQPTADRAATLEAETPLEKRLRFSERRNDELRAECRRRGKRVLEQSEHILALERQLDEVRRQLGAEILRAGQTEAELRRLADETQPAEAHPTEHTWAAELYDPVAEEWVPGTRYRARARAVAHLTHARAIGPTWKDGTLTQRRLVRATTTYTVEEPVPVVQQPKIDEAQPEGEPACAHCGGGHAWDDCEAYTALVAADGARQDGTRPDASPA
ncbi:hypothetical protein ACIF8T_21790 [Streptomyces sp. NPDC085946]|uniref:hypothetical protein n=1 Tax=Streptomyces sp. NPDC085946 TaxID=3365744 RepID=UPI0037D35E0D